MNRFIKSSNNSFLDGFFNFFNLSISMFHISIFYKFYNKQGLFKASVFITICCLPSFIPLPWCDLRCRFVRRTFLNHCMTRKERIRDTEWKNAKAKEGVKEREQERAEKRVSRGSEWLECTLMLVEWAAHWAGVYWRYCVDAAGVTVAVSDTKTTFHGRRHWLKAVARPLPADHTLSSTNYSFLR